MERIKMSETKSKKFLSLSVGFLIGFLIAGAIEWILFRYGIHLFFILRPYFKDILILTGFVGLVGMIFVIKFINDRFF